MLTIKHSVKIKLPAEVSKLVGRQALAWIRALFVFIAVYQYLYIYRFFGQKSMNSCHPQFNTLALYCRASS